MLSSIPWYRIAYNVLSHPMRYPMRMISYEYIYIYISIYDDIHVTNMRWLVDIMRCTPVITGFPWISLKTWLVKMMMSLLSVRNDVEHRVESLVVWGALTLMLGKCGPNGPFAVIIKRPYQNKYINSPHFFLKFLSFQAVGARSAIQ